jgi:hypothetical protein
VVVIARGVATPPAGATPCRSVAHPSVGPEPRLTRTVIEAHASPSHADAEHWLARAAGAGAEATVAAALDVLTAPCTPTASQPADPYVAEVARRAALVTRIGFGSGEQVAEGGWEQARELPPSLEAARPPRSRPPAPGAIGRAPRRPRRGPGL